MKKIKVGIPKSLIYPKYQTFYQVFFKELDIELITCDLEKLENLAIPSSCNHLKKFILEVKQLLNHCDYILIPTLTSLKKNDTLCPIITHLATITKTIIPEAQILTYEIDITHKKDELTGIISLGHQLKIPYSKITKAYQIAKTNEELFYQNKYTTTKNLLLNNNPKLLVFADTYTQKENILSQIDTNKITIIFTDFLDYRYNNISHIHLLNNVTDTFIKEKLKALETSLDKINGIIIVNEDCFYSQILTKYLLSKITNVPVYQYKSNESLQDFINLCLSKVEEESYGS